MTRTRWTVAAGALLAIALVLVLGRVLGGHVVRLVEWVDGLGPLAPAAFVLGYALATVAFIPGSLLTLAGGAVFGVVTGGLLVLLGATIGSSAAFLIARHLARGRVERRIADDRRFAAVDRAIERAGWRVVLLLRLSPVFPYNLLNYALGVTRVRFVHYLVASVGMIPGILLGVYTGRLVGSVAELASDAATPRGPGHYLLLVAGLAATALAAWYVTRLAREALREASV